MTKHEDDFAPMMITEVSRLQYSLAEIHRAHGCRAQKEQGYSKGNGLVGRSLGYRKSRDLSCGMVSYSNGGLAVLSSARVETSGGATTV